MLNKRMEEMIKLAYKNGLDPFPTVFEEIEQNTMTNIISYGLPTRGQHWSYGRSYDYHKTYGEMGYSKVYEVILNNNPSYAFMLDTNSDIQNLFITAHCAAHSDFMKNNCMFQGSDRNMIYHAAEHAGRIEKYIELYGIDKVEHLMDIAFALDDHIDWYKGINRKPYGKKKVITRRKKSHEFDDVLSKKTRYTEKMTLNDKFPPHPEKDLLWFFINYAPLENWEKDILDIIREESFYFYPQKMTKISNEGWACVSPGSLIFMPNLGLVRGIEVCEKKYKQILSGNGIKNISDYYISKKQSKNITTKKGYSLTGSLQHKVVVWENGNRTWKDFSSLKVGDKVEIRYNQQCWGENIVDIDFKSIPKKYGKFRNLLKLPNKVDKYFARFLGYFLAEGNIGKRCVCITNGEESVVDDIVKSIFNSFGILILPRKDGNRYRIEIYSQQLISLLSSIGALGYSYEKDIPEVILKSPRNIVEEFLSAYFSGDGGAYLNTLGIGYTSSEKLSKTLQVVLLNMGIISNRIPRFKNGYKINYEIAVNDSSSKNKMKNILLKCSSEKRKQTMKYYSSKFDFNIREKIFLNNNEFDKIKFLVKNKKQSLQKFYGINGYWKKNKDNFISKNQLISIKNMLDDEFPKEINWKLEDDFIIDEVDEITSNFVSDVVDFTVDEEHTYQAQGFVNHNSYWHAELMYQYDNILPEEFLDFVKTHEKVVQPGSNPFNINPYYLGFKIFKDIEKKWDEKYGKGAGKQKIFEVRRDENDISFLKNYLTPDLIQELKLFTYGYAGDYPEDFEGEKFIEIKEKICEEVVEAMVRPLYNSGVPKITIDGIGQEGSLILKHEVDDFGTLDFNFAKKTVEYIWDLWAAPVELYTMDKNNNEIIICFDEAGAQIYGEEEEKEEEPILLDTHIIFP